jgi:hypothetical protein
MAIMPESPLLLGYFSKDILLTEERKRPRAVLPFGHAQRPHRFAGTAR